MNYQKNNTSTVDFAVNSVVFTMIQHPSNTYIIDFTTNSVVFAMIQHPGNTYIIDFTMNNVVFIMIQHPNNTYIIDITSDLFKKSIHSNEKHSLLFGGGGRPRGGEIVENLIFLVFIVKSIDFALFSSVVGESSVSSTRNV